MFDAPWFEDFSVGNDYSEVPAVTITEGHAAIHQAIFGDRLRLPLDHVLSQKVTGEQRALVNPSLVCNMAIGQTTIPSQRVMGNLFYRGLVFQKPVFIGDTLTTSTKVVGLKQNKPKPNRPASGMVALEMHVKNQHGETVLLFWRCPMIPCRDPKAETGHNDSFDIMPELVPLETLKGAVPNWDLNTFQTTNSAHQFKNLPLNQLLTVEARDTVTLAPELVRMTLNMAMTHTDATRSVYGKRLVYGGHTISMAAAQLSRILPNMVTIVGWFHCDHVAPVFEQDILRTQVTLDEKHAITNGGIVYLHVETYALRDLSDPTAETKVLDWTMAALFA
jgi:2-methylfumaryl-CoA hydratase